MTIGNVRSEAAQCAEHIAQTIPGSLGILDVLPHKHILCEFDNGASPHEKVDAILLMLLAIHMI